MADAKRSVLEMADYFAFLDELRESGETNMFGARPYLRAEFPKLGPAEAGAILSAWMKTFSTETTPRERAVAAQFV